ncbi:MAG: hypothetical protein DMF03_10125 [Verrucomicrobia bacterium]|nr:MAG: hypothetical protein DMF03_10125 [Verrucomicrobiota bacterium]
MQFATSPDSKKLFGSLALSAMRVPSAATELQQAPMQGLMLSASPMLCAQPGRLWDFAVPFSGRRI